MAGRVIPMFTNNGVPGAGARRHPAARSRRAWARCSLLAALDLLACRVDARRRCAALAAAVARRALAALAALATLRVPLVWVLHLAYAWIPVHLVLRALARARLGRPSSAATTRSPSAPSAVWSSE